MIKKLVFVGVCLLLTSCQSKQQICAEAAAELSVPSQKELINYYWEKLDMPQVNYPYLQGIRNYCEHYK